MATTAVITPEELTPVIITTPAEYLRCFDFEPDAEFVDDHIEERPMGELDHSDLQGKLFSILSSAECKPHFKCNQELRVQINARRYRIPDLCLRRRQQHPEQVVVTAPLLCIEVLSPEDTMARTMVRVRDFLGKGVPEVWIFDSRSRVVYVCAGKQITEHTLGYLPVPETPITVSIEDAFSILDEEYR